jgi:hypothetical protein
VVCVFVVATHFLTCVCRLKWRRDVSWPGGSEILAVDYIIYLFLGVLFLGVSSWDTTDEMTVVATS